LKALIVDDEAPARSELRFLLAEAGGVEVVGEASDASEALQLIAAIEYDVVFVDVEMPGLSGLDLAEALPIAKPSPAVIFVTAYSEHALEAFEVAATDYIVKPVSLDRLRRALARIAAARGGAEAGARADAPDAAPGDPRMEDPEQRPLGPRAAPEGAVRIERVAVGKGDRTLLIAAEDILYVEAEDDYSRVHTTHGRYLSGVSLSVLQTRLEPLGFFRVHRSYLVDLGRVREVLPMYGGTLMLVLSDAAGTQIPVSRRRVAALKLALGM
jgi:DNA-binding LytR/AlgR family response regulator